MRALSQGVTVWHDYQLVMEQLQSIDMFDIGALSYSGI